MRHLSACVSPYFSKKHFRSFWFRLTFVLIKTYECMVSLGHNLCHIRILNIQKVFRFVHFWRSFPIERNVFWKNEHLHMHSSTQTSRTCIVFDADSELKVRFPRLWLFTPSRDKVWIQPSLTFNLSWIPILNESQIFSIFRIFLLNKMFYSRCFIRMLGIWKTNSLHNIF